MCPAPATWSSDRFPWRAPASAVKSERRLRSLLPMRQVISPGNRFMSMADGRANEPAACDLLIHMQKLLAVGVLAALPLAAQVKFTQAKNRIAVEIDGKPYTTFFYGPEVPKPYLHPLRAPSGIS